MNYDQIKLLMYKYPFIKRLLYPAVVTKRVFIRNKLKPYEKVQKQLCNLLAEDPVVKVDEFEGAFVIDVRSDLFSRLLINNYYEPTLVEIAHKYINRERDVIDVGANIGFFTVLFAKNLNGKKVLSIEPTKNALRRLYKNIQINHVEDTVLVYEGVASNQIGIAEIKTIEGKEEYSTLGNLTHPSILSEKYTSEKVAASTIDALTLQYSLDPGFIKVDAEGAEELVFDGCRAVLQKHRPVILSEISNLLLRENGSSCSEVINLIKQYEYNVIDPATPFLPVGSRELSNILCIPKEMG